MTAYLYRSGGDGRLVPYCAEWHGYPCDYIGGDEGPKVVSEEYLLLLDLGEQAVFLHRPTGSHYAAVRIGSPSLCPVGEDWRQGQAHLVLGTDIQVSQSLQAVCGPFSFYNLVFVLEGGEVTPREAVLEGYFGEAVWSLRGHVRPLACTSVEQALALLRVFSFDG